MATYLEELQELFPNGLHVPASSSAEQNKDVELLIDLFDDLNTSKQKTVDIRRATSTSNDLVDSILYQIHPSLVLGEGITRQSPPSSASTSVSVGSSTPTTASTGSKPSSSDVNPSSKGREVSAHDSKMFLVSHSVASDEHLPASPPKIGARSGPAPPATSISPTSNKSSPSSAISSKQSCADSSPTTLRFMSIAGRSAREQAETEARVAKAAGAAQPRAPTGARISAAPGRTSIFNKTSTRPVAPPPHRRTSSSESEESPPRRPAPSSSYRSRAAASTASARGGGRLRDVRERGKVVNHSWDFDGTEVTKPALQGRYISSGQIVDRGAPPPGREPDFIGYQNGWKPPTASAARHPSEGYVLGCSTRRSNNAPDDNEEDDGRTPFHWTGDVATQAGKTRLIGKGALGSRPGTFKDRSEERFAAATAALEREQDMEYANRVPDPIENMHPAAASWEMQRRGILLRNDRRPRVSHALA